VWRVKDGKGIDTCVEWSGMSTCVQRTDGMEHVWRGCVSMCGGDEGGDGCMCGGDSGGDGCM